jgi:hypothetical protein
MCGTSGPRYGEYEKNITTEHLVETALGGYAAVSGGRVFFAFDLLRLNDVFVGQFGARLAPVHRP